MVTKQELEAAKIDVKNAGEAVNEKKIVNPRYGAPFKSLPLAIEELNIKADDVIAKGFYTGYASLQSFIDAMYKDEASQLDAMCRYIKVNNLISALKNKDWKAFARGYNGRNYAINKYDVKLADAYKKALK